MSTSIDSATGIGLAVAEFLASPDSVDPDSTADLTGSFLARAGTLQAIGLISETQLATIREIVLAGELGKDLSDNPYTVGGFLITTARRYPYYRSPFASLTAALLFVVNAAAGAVDPGGEVGATACAALASMRVLSAHKDDDPNDHAHKDHAHKDGAHKDHIPS
jgi:hypothetical protein